jgi:photosystem II stability/assembly factor-like uncharacterized protein
MRLRSLAVSFLVLPLLGAGCIRLSSAPQQAAGGGVFLSPDKGVTWVQKVALQSAKGAQSISGVDVLAFAFDPQDLKAVYLGTGGSGLLFSYDGGDSWQRAGGVGAGRVPAVAVHPKEKCTIYAALGNRVIRSTDCSRSYDILFTDPRGEAQVTSLVIDWFNPRQIYIGTATGELSRSSDGGATWAPVQRWEDGIAAVQMSAADSRKIWVATKNNGLALTEDGGATWQDLRKGMDAYDGARAFAAMAEDRTAPGTLLHASRYGMLKSVDSGRTWEPMNILTPPQSVAITALAINPKNGKEIYYTTGTKLYRSQDGGGNWATSDLPTSRVASALAVDPTNDAVLYLGVSAPKK